MSNAKQALKNIRKRKSDWIGKCKVLLAHMDELKTIEEALERLEKIDDLLEEIGIDENDLPIWYEMQLEDGKKVNVFEIVKKYYKIGLIGTSYEKDQACVQLIEKEDMTIEEMKLLTEALSND